MITSVAFLFFLGFYLLTVTSKRAFSYPPGFIHVLLAEKRSAIKTIAVFLVVGAYALLIAKEGFGMGIVYGSILLMAIASLTLLLQPLKSFNYKGLLLLYVGLLLLELIL